MKMPQTRDQWVQLVKDLFWAIGKVRLFMFICGIVLTLTVQLLTGFWAFRDNHQKLILKQYEAAVAAGAKFDEQLSQYNLIFEGKLPSGSTYSADAQKYVGSLRAVSNLLPSTSESLEDYISALAKLNRYYSRADVPVRGSQDWMIFYGSFRLDFDRYMTAREEYMGQLSSELGDYVRHVRNS